MLASFWMMFGIFLSAMTVAIFADTTSSTSNFDIYEQDVIVWEGSQEVGLDLMGNIVVRSIKRGMIGKGEEE